MKKLLFYHSNLKIRRNKHMLENTEELQENNEVQAKIENEYNKLQLFLYRLNYDEPGTSYYESHDKNNDMTFMVYVVTKAFEASMFTFRNKDYKIVDFEERTDFSPYNSLRVIADLVRANGESRPQFLGLSDYRNYDYSFTFKGQPFPVTNPPIDDNLGIGTIKVSLNENIATRSSELIFSLED